MKTAMQELWDYVIEDKQNINFIAYMNLRNRIIPLLEKEKLQIAEAYENGNLQEDYTRFENALNYYEETYKK
jgi:hypothetical protein